MLKCRRSQTHCAFLSCCPVRDHIRPSTRHNSISFRHCHSHTSYDYPSTRAKSLSVGTSRKWTSHDSCRAPRRWADSRHYASISHQVAPDAHQDAASNAQVLVDLRYERWVSCLELLLPGPLRVRTGTPQPLPSGNLREREIITQLANTILEARKESQLDLLAHLGLENQRWAAVLHVVRMLAEHIRPPTNPLILASAFAFPCSNAGTLNEVSASPILLDASSKLYRRAPRPAAVANAGQLRSDSYAATTPLPIIGSIWRTIGSLLTSCINLSPDVATETQSNVLQMISLLYTNGHLPTTLFTAPLKRNNDPSAPQRPSWLAHYASLLQTSSFISAGPAMTASRSGPQAQSGNSSEDVPSESPARWIEFVLWSCLETGHLMEATAILREVKRMQGLRKISIGATSNVSLEESNQERTSEHSSATHHISPDVVIAIIDGLITSLSTDHMQIRYTPFKVFERVAMLEGLLRRDRMSLGSTTWEAAIARIADASNINVEDNATFLAAALTLAPRYGREEQAPNSPSRAAPVNAATYVFDGCAALLGLYHRAIHALVRHGAIGEALQTLLNLQKLIDRTKKDSLHDFFQAMNSMKMGRDNLEPLDDGRIKLMSSSPFTRVDYPGFHRHIPTKVLADLLDLVTDSKVYEIGRWMTMTNDIDGPLISESLYNDPIMAPALIRYATASHERRFLSVLVKAQARDIQGETMLALCDVRIQNGDFDGAVDVLNYVQEFCMHDWTCDDVCRLIKGLLLHIPADEKTASPPVALLQRILRGDLYQISQFDFAELEVIAAILFSMKPCPSILKTTCSELIAVDSEIGKAIPVSSFNFLLDGIVRAYGSTCGRHIWETWCLNHLNGSIPSAVATPSDVLSSQKRQRRLATFSQRTSGKSPEVQQSPRSNARASITPNLASIRIIIRGALAELKNSEMSASHSRNAVQPQQATDPARRRNEPLRDSTLDWSAGVLRSFGFSEDDIDYELHGYLSSFNVALSKDQAVTSPYSLRTYSIWRSFSSTSRRIWVLARERELRSFASAAEGQQKYFSLPPMPPAEAALIMSFAADLNLAAEIVLRPSGEDLDTPMDPQSASYRGVRVMRRPDVAPVIPSQTVDEALRLQARRQRQLGGFREVLLERNANDTEA